MESTLDRAKRIIAVQLDRDEEDIRPQTELEEDLGADPVDLEALLMAVEEEFDFTISERAVRGFKTVGDVVRYIDENL